MSQVDHRNSERRDLGALDGPLLIFGGPYGNLAATRALQGRAAALGIGPEQVICTGDLVAYCAEPAATVDRLRAWGIPVVMGNCEEALALGANDCGCGFDPGTACSTLAMTWYRYADARIDAAQRAWMRALPRRVDFALAGKRFAVVHGSLRGISDFVFASSDADAKRAQLAEAGVDAIVGGHCGIPFGQSLGGGWWLNAGVIGMPANDGRPATWYLLLQPTAAGIRASWHALDYDFAASRASTRAAGMAEYGEALASGLWPSMDVLPEAEQCRRGRPLRLPPLVL